MGASFRFSHLLLLVMAESLSAALGDSSLLVIYLGRREGLWQCF